MRREKEYGKDSSALTIVVATIQGLEAYVKKRVYKH